MISPTWLRKLAKEEAVPRTGMRTTCWNWKGRHHHDGYAAITVERKDRVAHRVIYARCKRVRLSRQQLVCHRCDNKSCVRPSHMFVGSSKQNSQDMVRKGRSSFGHRNGSAKFGSETAREIVRAYMAGEMTQTELAKKYGVGQTVVSAIITGRTWSRVTGITYKKRGRAVAHVHRVEKYRKVGEAHHSTRLKDDDVRCMRSSYAEEKETVASLARKYGVSRAAVHGVIRRKTWRHIA